MNNLNENIMRMLEKAVLILAEKEVNEQTECFMSGQVENGNYQELKRRVPVRTIIEKTKSKLLSNSPGLLSLIKRYQLLKICNSIAEFSRLSLLDKENTPSFEHEIESLCELSGKNVRQVSFVPDPESFSPLTLNYQIVSDNVNCLKPDDGPPLKPDHSDMIEIDSQGTFSIVLDDTSGIVAHLEVGDAAILIHLDGVDKSQINPKVFFHGVHHEHQQKINWLDDQSFMIKHDFENPELLNVTLIQDETSADRSFVFWAGVEKDLICAILEKMYPDPRQRLAWWWRPIKELDDYAPIQCVKKRREDMVLDYLSRVFDFKSIQG